MCPCWTPGYRLLIGINRRRSTFIRFVFVLKSNFRHKQVDRNRYHSTRRFGRRTWSGSQMARQSTHCKYLNYKKIRNGIAKTICVFSRAYWTQPKMRTKSIWAHGPSHRQMPISEWNRSVSICCQRCMISMSICMEAKRMRRKMSSTMNTYRKCNHTDHLGYVALANFNSTTTVHKQWKFKLTSELMCFLLDNFRDECTSKFGAMWNHEEQTPSSR